MKETPGPLTGPALAEDGESRGASLIRVAVPAFTGPLDLLLHLIQRDEIEITDIPIARITREYLTSDEFTWEADALEQRGYELAHEPFTSAEGLIVVTYRLEEEPAEEYPVQEYWG